MDATDLDAATALGTTPLRSVYGYVLGCTVQAHTALWTAEVGAEPTSPQFAVLEVLADQPGSDQRRVGELAFLDKSSTMDIVRRLTHKQWITRERNALDSRRDVLSLTSAAGYALHQLRPIARQVQKLLLDPLDAHEQATFLERIALVARVDLDTHPLNTSQLPGMLLRRARQVHTALIAEHIGDGITGPQLSALISLRLRPKMNQRELGEMAGLDKSTTADIVSRLDRRGWISRRRDPQDGRRQLLELTAAGVEAARTLGPPLQRCQALALAPLDRSQHDDFLASLATLARVGDV